MQPVNRPRFSTVARSSLYRHCIFRHVQLSARHFRIEFESGRPNRISKLRMSLATGVSFVNVQSRGQGICIFIRSNERLHSNFKKQQQQKQYSQYTKIQFLHQQQRSAVIGLIRVTWPETEKIFPTSIAHNFGKRFCKYVKLLSDVNMCP